MTIRIDKPLFEHFVAASLLAPLVSLTVYHLLWGDSDVVFYGHALLVFGAFALATVNALTLAIWHFREVRPLALVGFGVMALRVLWLVGWDDVPEQHKFAYFLIAALGDAASAGALQVLLGRFGNMGPRGFRPRPALMGGAVAVALTACMFVGSLLTGYLAVFLAPVALGCLTIALTVLGVALMRPRKTDARA